MSLECVWHPTTARLRKRLFALPVPQRERIKSLGQLYLFDWLDHRHLSTDAAARAQLGFTPSAAEKRIARAWLRTLSRPIKWRENRDDEWTICPGSPRFTGVPS